MAPINPDIFSTITSDLTGMVQRWNHGFQQLTPDRPLASVPYAPFVERANIPNGAISLDMLDSGLRSSLQPEQIYLFLMILTDKSGYYFCRS